MYHQIYPERASEGIVKRIEKLVALDSGSAEVISLTSEERERVCSVESHFGGILEKIFAITPKEISLYII